jgi:hypothetical protein
MLLPFNKQPSRGFLGAKWWTSWAKFESISMQAKRMSTYWVMKWISTIKNSYFLLSSFKDPQDLTPFFLWWQSTKKFNVVVCCSHKLSLTTFWIKVLNLSFSFKSHLSCFCYGSTLQNLINNRSCEVLCTSLGSLTKQECTNFCHIF